MLRLLYFLEPLPMEDCIKSPLSVCQSFRPSVHQFGTFLRNSSLVFFLLILKADWAHFSRKIHFWPNLSKWTQKVPKEVFFYFFWNILSLDLLGSNLKWKLILLLIFHHQSHIWQNSGSQVMGQNAVSQSNCRIV